MPPQKRKRPKDEKGANKNKQEKKQEDAVPLPVGNCVDVSQRFKKIGRVGEGTYGIVYKAEDRQNPGDFVALKRCIPHHQATDGFPITAMREIQALRLLQHHPHVISLRTDISMVAVNKNDVFLVFEYCQHDLAQLLDHQFHKQQQQRGGLYASSKAAKSPFRQAHVKTLLQQLLSAMECLHEHRLIHRDIKVSNLLYSDVTGHLKLADFGLARSLPATKADENGGYLLTANVVSLWYRAPELLLGSKTYNQSIDLFAVGCVFAELLRGYPLWSGKTVEEQIQTMFKSLGPPSRVTWPKVYDMPLVASGKVSLLDATQKRKVKTSSMPLLDSFSFLSNSGLMLLSHLLHYDPQQRLTATQALQSSYWTSEPLPTPPAQMPKFKSLHPK